MDTFTVVVTVLCWFWIVIQGLGWLLKTPIAMYIGYQGCDGSFMGALIPFIIFTFVFGLLMSPAIAILCLI